MKKNKLVFIYNADSGRLNLAFDIAHKILSPSTYQCDLCSLSHGYFRMQTSWRDFIQGLDVEVEYLHRDEYPATAPSGLEFPLILQQTADAYELFLSRGEISACDSSEALQQAILSKLLN